MTRDEHLKHIALKKRVRELEAALRLIANSNSVPPCERIIARDALTTQETGVAK